MKIRRPVDTKKCRVSVKFGRWYFLGRHKGIDYAPLNKTMGQPIRAVADFTWKEMVHSNKGYGNYVVLDHGKGWTSLYGHLLKINYKSGWKTGKAGDVIGYMGGGQSRWKGRGISTGVHLHFEFRKNNIPVNPEIYFV